MIVVKKKEYICLFPILPTVDSMVTSAQEKIISRVGDYVHGIIV